jgi:hypothetical protein
MRNKRLRYEVIKSLEYGEYFLSEGEPVSVGIEQAEELVVTGHIIPVNEDMDAYIELMGSSTAEAGVFTELSCQYQKNGLSEKDARRKAFIEAYCTHKDCIKL